MTVALTIKPNFKFFSGLIKFHKKIVHATPNIYPQYLFYFEISISACACPLVYICAKHTHTQV